MMAAYYNEIDGYAAQWLRNLIAAGLIADGEVDERSIVDVRPDDLRGFTQCHFFAGLGGWSYAARLAGWPDEREMWTGSCPCQPFSRVGRGLGTADERHLWPEFARLIKESRPSVVFGEQVTGGLADTWLDGVATDLETEDYAFAAAVLPSYGAGLPMDGPRWFWVSVLPSRGDRGVGQGASISPSAARQEWPRSQADLRAVFDAPQQPGECHPQPIVRLDADGIPPGVAKSRTRCAGNAIVPQVAKAFIEAVMEVSP